jgi:4-aminobutyrate aminotransferase/(S)-3-amino-2-methylpropionate transaminase
MKSSREGIFKDIRDKFVPKGLANSTPLFAERAIGAVIYDVEGREIIDLAGGIGVMNVGHSHPKVVAAIRDQAEKFTHTCFGIVMYEGYVRLAEKLCALVPGEFTKMAIFGNCGAEAVENAVKMARHYTKRDAVIAFDNAFHGRTYLAMTLTSKVIPYKLGFGPFMSDVHRMPYAYCYRCPFGLKYPGCDTCCADYLKEFFIGNVAAESTAALIVEPLQGEGGFITPPPEFLPKLLKICRENGIVFIADEIQSGMGRTGKMFAVNHWNVEPDMMTIGKGIGAGMPLSALVGRSEIMNSPQVGGLGGTYSGNPICCEAALAVIKIFEEENLLQRSEKLGIKVRARFEDFKKRFELVGDVRGLGPMVAMELVMDRETKEPAATEAKALVKFCYERGVVILSCGNFNNVIRTLMPLVITDEELERGLAIVEDGLASLSK